MLAAHGYPPELVGGTELSVQSLAHALVRAGHEVVVVSGSMRAVKDPETSEAIDERFQPRRARAMPDATRDVPRDVTRHLAPDTTPDTTPVTPNTTTDVT